jgi:glutathione S-transferase
MEAIGHGTRIDIDPDEALAVARAASPSPQRPSEPQEGDPQPGERARVRASDNARDWTEGEVNFIDADEIALLRSDPQVGVVAVHFPRLGYDWRRAR